MDPAYTPLPDDWTIGVFHRQIDQGDCKSALQGSQHGRRLGDRGRDHALDGREFPLFGGSASFARPAISPAPARRWRRPQPGSRKISIS
jgi:hypothetical protein